MALPKIIYRGSVKDIRGVEGRSPYIFEFSDRYSVFDWGEMPDELAGKGEALAFMTWLFFDLLGDAENWRGWKAPAKFDDSPVLAELREHGARHHGLGLVDENGDEIDPRGAPDKIGACYAVAPVRVLRPETSQQDGKLVRDYGAYDEKPDDALVPLEVIFRFGVPEGSSLLQRADDAEYCKSLGLDAPPKAGERFDAPVIEFSTKLESRDRYLTYKDAARIAGLTPEEMCHLHGAAALVASRLRDLFAESGIELWDGKLEFAFAPGKGDGGARGFMLVDSIGPDELRLIKDGVHLSKECLRGFYRDGPWHRAVERAKQVAESRGVEDWKDICIREFETTPPHLTAELADAAAMIYKSLANTLAQKTIGLEVFRDAWSLDETVNALKPDDAPKREGTTG